MMCLAMQYGKMTVQEAFKAVTINAALSLSLKNVGMVDDDAQADLIAWKLDSIDQIPYYNVESSKFITHIIKKGKIFPTTKPKKVYKSVDELLAAAWEKKIDANLNEMKKSLK